jgi:hypothetical protein
MQHECSSGMGEGRGVLSLNLGCIDWGSSCLYSASSTHRSSVTLPISAINLD